MINRKETTRLLSDSLVRDILRKKYWANEVTFNCGRTGEFRVDFMSFAPENQSTSGIEKGIFTAYEVKCCLPDYKSENGHNLVMDKNYYVMPMELYQKVVRELPHNVGVYIPIPFGKTKHEEFENPTKTEELQIERVTMQCVMNAHLQDRTISNTMALFCMLRSGYVN